MSVLFFVWIFLSKITKKYDNKLLEKQVSFAAGKENYVWKEFYITTPIYYPSSKLHILCLQPSLVISSSSTNASWADVFYLTGLDERSESSKSGEGSCITCWWDGSWCQELWRYLISHTINLSVQLMTIRKWVAQVFELAYSDDIYLIEILSGWYSVSDEEFFTENRLASFPWWSWKCN